MIPAAELKEKMGKEKFIEFATHSQKGERMVDRERRRGYGSRVRYRMCQHGAWVIEDYEPRPCLNCHNYRSTKFRDFEPHFNIGLGGWVESKRDMMETAKKQKLVWIGDDKIK